ncbi:hypothetical protein HYU16_00175 [Candidatus Woesearchaeota archaeon]|nr:hypothetical protein [Candidatus Woesearchaeota archaeon]
MKKILLRTKRGIFFTSIAILIAAVLIVTFGTQRAVTMKDQLPATQAKADSANAQVKDLRNSYLPQSLYIATYSAFYAMADYMRQRGNYFLGADASLKFNNTLKEMIINGTMCCGLAGHMPPCDTDSLADVNNPAIHKGVDQCLGIEIMRGRNLTRRLQEMENASFRAFGINTSFGKNYNAMRLLVFQDNWTGPWQVGVNLTVNYSVVAGDVMINNTENISTIFGIHGIPDPLYAVGSRGAAEDGSVVYTNYFNATNITNLNISTFHRQIDLRVYRHEPNASSFLDRFYGNDVRSPCCGVESLINPFVMASVNGQRERPYVDWCYYGSGNRCTAAQTGQVWNVTCVTKDADTPPPEFYRFAIDSYHAARYNLTNEQDDYLYGVGPPPACPESPFP